MAYLVCFSPNMEGYIPQIYPIFCQMMYFHIGYDLYKALFLNSNCSCKYQQFYPNMGINYNAITYEVSVPILLYFLQNRFVQIVNYYIKEKYTFWKQRKCYIIFPYLGVQLCNNIMMQHANLASKFYWKPLEICKDTLNCTYYKTAKRNFKIPIRSMTCPYLEHEINKYLIWYLPRFLKNYREF